jgi:benzoyl-CoA reductase/2-hydroxyglutaryl-CoA dehydratase subunit BcrC/BadD/HgdB
MNRDKKYIAFSCAYTPLQLIDAAGFIPWKILPAGIWPERAGEILHENLCPNVKRILDWGLEGDLPELAGVVFMNSCDGIVLMMQHLRSDATLQKLN